MVDLDSVTNVPMQGMLIDENVCSAMCIQEQLRPKPCESSWCRSWPLTSGLS